MKKNKFEYFLNTILFFIYKEEVWSNRIFDKIIWKCFFVVSKFLSLESYYHKRRNIFRKDSNYQNYMYGKKTGQSIGLANHWLGFFYSAYSAFFSWVLVGIANRAFGDLNIIAFLFLFGIPIGICYIPAYKAVFTDDKYLIYFKQFEKEDEHWHKKWKRRTYFFCIGALLTLLIGFFSMVFITTI